MKKIYLKLTEKELESINGGSTYYPIATGPISPIYLGAKIFNKLFK
ncbi:bacteriocin [Clostridium perfringens]|nr:bacteriocin [Clostridium perfringens]MCX0386935.1 bacteriocin [Clostridium perfringens]